MKERREKQKLRMLERESAPPLAEAAFAEDEDLFAAPERIHHDRPFFERDSHALRLSAANRFGNRLDDY